MRLVEVRDLIAGQGWFDLTQHRLDPPGVSIHWSRVIDAPLAVSDAGATRYVFPGCLASPYADVDPILATFWLDSVAEATSLQSMLQLVPQKIPGFYGFPVLTLGLAGAAPIAPPRRPDFDHAIIAAPYHRNNNGNLAMLSAFLAPPHNARQILSGRHVDCVVMCSASPE
jgi:hypothetical protein